MWTCLLTRDRHLLCRRQSDVLCFVLAVITICLDCVNTALELQIAFKNTFTVLCPMLWYITLYYRSAFITDNIANYFQLENDNVCIKTNSFKIKFRPKRFLLMSSSINIYKRHGCVTMHPVVVYFFYLCSVLSMKTVSKQYS